MIFWIIVGALLITWICGVICIFSEGKYLGRIFHKVLGWHFPKEEITAEGIIIKSRCKFCDKEIQMDSQGNWY